MTVFLPSTGYGSGSIPSDPDPAWPLVVAAVVWAAVLLSGIAVLVKRWRQSR